MHVRSSAAWLRFPARVFSQQFSSTRRGARLARILAEHQLDAWGVPYGSEPSETVAGVVAELAANAVTHGQAPGADFEVCLILTATAVRVEVTDARGDALPPPCPERPADDEEDGRGLLLVAVLAARWGVRQWAGDTRGKTVWAEVPLPPLTLGPN